MEHSGMAADKAKTKKDRQAKKVGGIWVDPMSFPALTEYDHP